jgi:hypothetical protein
MSCGQVEQRVGGGLKFRLRHAGAENRPNLLVQQRTTPPLPLDSVARAKQKRREGSRRPQAVLGRLT